MEDRPIRRWLITTVTPLLLLISTQISAEIHEIDSMQNIHAYIDKDTLVIFDLDHTVFEADSDGYGHLNWFYEQIENGKAKGVNEKVVIFNLFPHWRLSQEKTQVEPVESVTPEIIRAYQKAGNPVLALTARQMALSEITLTQLKDIDVNFSSPKLPDTLLHDFHAPTLMKDGVLFCAEYNDKGEVLKEYLKALKLKPKNIVFIDDSKKYLLAVERAFPEIDVIGLHYPKVANRQTNWDGVKAHQAYCEAALKYPELKDYPLDDC